MDSKISNLEQRVLSLEERIFVLENELLKSSRPIPQRVVSPFQTVNDGTKKASTPFEPTQVPRIPESEEPVFWKQSDFWLNKMGVVFLLISVTYFYSYSVEQGWISPLLRVIFGFLVGIGLFTLSYFVKENRVYMAELLKGVSLGIFYLSIYAAFQWYDLINQTFAFIITISITGFSFRTALKENNELIAFFAVLGGYIAPYMLSNSESNFIGLLAFVTIITVSASYLALYRGWRKVGGFAIAVGWSQAFVGFQALFIPNELSLFTEMSIAICFILLFIATGPIRYVKYELTKDWFEWDLVILLSPPSILFIFKELFVLSDKLTGVMGWSFAIGFITYALLKAPYPSLKAILSSSAAMLSAVSAFYFFQGEMFIIITVYSALISAYVSCDKPIFYQFLDFMQILLGVIMTYTYFFEHQSFIAFLHVDSILFLSMLAGLIWYLKSLPDESFQRIIGILAHVGLLIWIHSELYHLSYALITSTTVLVLYVIGLLIYGARIKHLFIQKVATISFIIIMIKLFIFDLSSMQLFFRFVLLAVLGSLFMIVSYLYKRLTKDESPIEKEMP